MTAPIGTSANRFTGLRELSNVANCYAGYLQSGGVAYNMTLPFYPDKFQWYRYTAFGTAGTLGQGVWFRDFPAGDSLIHQSIADNGVTGNTSLLLEATNGITVNNSAGGFTDQHLVITGITTAGPAVVTTSAVHGLADNDRVYITKVIGTMADEVNDKEFVVDVLSTTTFALYDAQGNAVTTVGAYTSSGQVTKEGPSLGIENAAPTYRLTLGSSVMGADNDVIYFEAWQYNNYVNLGDVA